MKAVPLEEVVATRCERDPSFREAYAAFDAVEWEVEGAPARIDGRSSLLSTFGAATLVAGGVAALAGRLESLFHRTHKDE